MNSWLLFSILAPLGWGLSNVIDSVVRRHLIQDDLISTWFLGIIRIPLVLILVFIFGLTVPHNTGTVIWMIGASFFWMFPFIFYYKAIAFEEPSRVALLLESLPVFTAVVAYFAIGEVLSEHQLIAFLLILLGNILASVKKFAGVWKFSRALWLILIGTGFWAISDVFFKKFEPGFSTFWQAFIVYSAGESFFSLILTGMPSVRKKIGHFLGKLKPRDWILILFNQLLGMGASLAFAYALTLGKASLTAVVIGLQPLFVFIIGLVLVYFIPRVMREEVSRKILLMKGASLVLIIAGLIMLQ